ncbi:glycosyltransferase family 2 protein [Bosea sp. R86505]|uniref:glycosyltransferase family 2 protein n=1 Tax=Bosea sp. R86505 TaxID=3101710 RepID=UPI00366DFAD2
MTFFVPCYNEEPNIEGTIETIHEAATQVGVRHEILVFDDCSRDGTVEVVKRVAAARSELPLRLLRNAVNQGLARNFIDGAFEGHGTYYRLVCGDNVEPVETLVKILQNLGQSDIIVPYHTHVEGRTLRRKLISRLYTKLVNLASGRDLHYYNGLPLVRRRDVLRFHVEATGLGYQAEFLLRLLQEGRSFIQIPLTASDKEGSLALSLRNFVSVGHSLFKIAMRRLSIHLFGKR